MIRAIWNDTILAEAEATETVEGNHYFPPGSVKSEHLRPSEHHTSCFWKGTASYYDVVANGKTGTNLAWYYPDPKRKARHIADHVAFYPQVTIAVD
ncbi:DUF427 domain-containing protein [Hoyosella sp. G463]|uniref:DUF427 domain-containing protein n=1 Tax=Lolliginicoccus lacisalsi TaxID=2742202 RepID=A0A927J905_9ACTN|nr:DUF427 domain-containing protein [Lolliginicoccus lacisalsi]MBD8504908.1 DUF427 domain-containing protein [Lolliginicoccus lacisalsi]